jgi:hypothetical protein
MPSFAFWKSSKTDEAKASLLTDDAGKDEANVVLPVVAKNLDLNPGEKDSGVFLFDEEIPQPSPQPSPRLSPEQSSALDSSQSQQADVVDITVSSGDDIVTIAGASADTETHGEDVREEKMDDPCPNSQSNDHEKLPSSPSKSTASPITLYDDSPIDTQTPTETDENVALVQQAHEDAEQPTATESLPAQSTPPTSEKITIESDEGDSGVCLSDDDSFAPRSRAASLAMSEDTSRSRASSLSSKHTAAVKCSATPQRTDSTSHRLKRPAELNLGANAVTDASKPRSELEKRYDLIRNSKTKAKAALRSPTELLNERLNMSPKKGKKEEVRIFTPPKPLVNGCWLPGPGARMDAFTSTSVRARTEAGGRPAWWCKFDKLVVFDGIEAQADGDVKINTRTSKGLSIARRRGDTETIVIPMDCTHCQEMLNRHEWKYDMQVCKRSVCWDCKERCKWELEEEKRVDEASGDQTEAKSDGNRYRADSVLQDEQNQEKETIQKDCIEKPQPMSPVETMGGIEERLEGREAAY